MENKTVRHTLIGRIILTGHIRLLTGLHIGGKQGEIAIGGVDSAVIRNPVDGKPYIPGSSLKGKMRSQSEKLTGAPQKWPIRKQEPSVYIHVAETEADYNKYWVNPIFGVMGDKGGVISAPNRLIVRDISLSEKSAKLLNDLRTDVPYSEVKWEAAIDRVTSAATPRQIERVPAGAVFGPMELVFSVYLPEDLALFNHVLTALQLVEDDYLGGHGSRGSGKVAFEKLTFTCKHGTTYTVGEPRAYDTLAAVDANALQTWLSAQIQFPA